MYGSATRTSSRPGLLLPLLAGLLAACGAPEAELPSPAKSVVLTQVEQRDVEERIVATGELRAKEQATIAAQVAGEVTKVLVDEGDAVAEGDVVLEIDPERRELDVERARARIGEAQADLGERRRELARVRELASRNVASVAKKQTTEAMLAAAESRLAGARAELGVMERALADATVRAPFTGLVARRLVSRGEFVQPGKPLYELVALQPIEVEFHLPEAEASRVRLGLPLRVSVAPYPGEVFPATVSVISPTVDARTRTLRVKAVLENADGRLSPGLFARADLGIARRENVRILPEEAVLQRADGSVVFKLVDGDRVERRVVEPRLIRDGEVEITSGIEPGDRVVLRGHQDLIDGSLVVARNADGSIAPPAVGAAPEGSE